MEHSGVWCSRERSTSRSAARRGPTAPATPTSCPTACGTRSHPSRIRRDRRLRGCRPLPGALRLGELAGVDRQRASGHQEREPAAQNRPRGQCRRGLPRARAERSGQLVERETGCPERVALLLQPRSGSRSARPRAPGCREPRAPPPGPGQASDAELRRDVMGRPGPSTCTQRSRQWSRSLRRGRGAITRAASRAPRNVPRRLTSSTWSQRATASSSGSGGGSMPAALSPTSRPSTHLPGVRK